MKPLTLSAEDSPAKTSASPEKAPGLLANDQDSGTNTAASSKKSTRVTSSSKTLQPFALEDWIKFSGASLRSGIARNGTVYPLQPSARLIKGIESGSWPTPTTMDGIAPKTPKAIIKEMTVVRPGRTSPSNLRDQVTWGRTFKEVQQKLWPTPQASDHRDRGNLSNSSIQRRLSMGKQLNLSMVVSPHSGQLNPTWVEWLMGFPEGWTDLNS